MISNQTRNEHIRTLYQRVARWSYRSREAWLKRFPEEREKINRYRKEMGWIDEGEQREEGVSDGPR